MIRGKKIKRKHGRIGNSSGEGARQVLLSNKKRGEAEEIAMKITYFEINEIHHLGRNTEGESFYSMQILIFIPALKRNWRQIEKDSTEY